MPGAATSSMQPVRSMTDAERAGRRGAAARHSARRMPLADDGHTSWPQRAPGTSGASVPGDSSTGEGETRPSRETPHAGIQYRGRRVWVGAAETDLCYKTSAERIANDARNEDPYLALLPLIRRRGDGLLCMGREEGKNWGGGERRMRRGENKSEQRTGQ